MISLFSICFLVFKWPPLLFEEDSKFNSSLQVVSEIFKSIRISPLRFPVLMDSVATSGSGSARCKKEDKTRRSWSGREEDVPIQSLKEVMTKGWKSENSFKAVYLTLLENTMHVAIPGTNMCANPHINSKIHVWKKTYSTLVTLLSKSGVSWNDTDKTIDATDETWESIVKHDPSFRPMRHKHWMLSMIGLKSSETIELLGSIQRILRMRYNKFLNLMKNFPT
ncbi:uncharacterized protein [Primulina eburnea]|uniref:uncharacterized protein n=1 Tax=Primulina eburnea TaxID=1245227 RepID=UPI003C6CB789